MVEIATEPRVGRVSQSSPSRGIFSPVSGSLAPGSFSPKSSDTRGGGACGGGVRGMRALGREGGITSPSGCVEHSRSCCPDGAQA